MLALPVEGLMDLSPPDRSPQRRDSSDEKRAQGWRMQHTRLPRRAVWTATAPVILQRDYCLSFFLLYSLICVSVVCVETRGTRPETLNTGIPRFEPEVGGRWGRGTPIPLTVLILWS